MKPQRNDLCPCGSGRKYKKCCAQPVSTPLAPPRPAEPAPAAEGRPTIERLYALLAAGRYAPVEVEARALVHAQPEAGTAWKLLGLSLMGQGKDALQILQRAVQLSPQDAEAHGNLGHLLRGQRQLAAAVASYRRALELAPALAEVRLALGNALRELGQPGEAVTAIAAVLELHPDHYAAHNDLGSALLDLGEIDRAVVSYRQALRINPDYAEADCNLGHALRLLGQPDEAIAHCRRALERRPGFAEAHNHLANALLDLGQGEQAVACYRRALQINPVFTLAQLNLGNAFIGLGRLEEAAASLRGVLAHSANHPAALTSLGKVLRLQGRGADAEALAVRALQIRPDSATALVLLAEVRADKGQFAEAETLLARAVTLDPDLPAAWIGIARYRRMTADDPSWLAAVQRLLAGRLAPADAIALRFAMGKTFDDQQDYERAFHSYREANEMVKRHSSAYDAQQVTRYVDAVTRTYTQDLLSELRDRGVSSARPVFIVGMPRSGTSLVEQIIASHPAAFGAGELTFWNDAMAAQGSSAIDTAPDQQTITRLAHDYLALLEGLSPNATRIVDKMPANFLNLGLIHAALPDARIIHVQRNPIDTCLSIYFQHYTVGFPYAHDLDDLAHFYSEYVRLMRHWHAILPEDALLDLPYESLVGDQQGWSRRMIDFIGLPWDSRCLDFHLTDRVVNTASKWQVRQQMSRASVERWRHYAPFIGPLRRLLDQGPLTLQKIGDFP